MARRFKNVKGLPYQGDKEFEVVLLTGDRLEVRDKERNDYAIIPISKTLKNRLSTKNDVPYIGSVYVVVAEDILLDTEDEKARCNHANVVANKVKKKDIKFVENREYSIDGEYEEVSDTETRKFNIG